MVKFYSGRDNLGEGQYGEWRYLLASESDIKDSKESWPALSKLAG